jgi:TolB-like protein
MSGKSMLFLLILISSMSTYAQDQKKNTVAVLDFEGIGVSKNEASILTERFRSELVNTQAFIVIERGQMDEILSEMGFQQSGCTSSECMVEIGQMLNVHNMVGGTIGKIGNVYTLDVRMIKVETSQILGSVSQDHEGDISGLLKVIKFTASEFSGILTQPSAPATQKSKIGMLQIFSSPADAKVFLNGDEVGATPFRLERLEVGTYQIKIVKRNFEQFEKNVVVTENAIATVRTDLIALYRLSIKSQPSGVKVFVNNKEDGKTPYNRIFRQGQYQIRLVMQNYKNWEDQIQLNDNETLEAELEYTDEYVAKYKPDEGGSSTWLYIAGGAVVIGAAAAILLQPKDETNGQISTTDLPGPPNPPTQ